VVDPLLWADREHPDDALVRGLAGLVQRGVVLNTQIRSKPHQHPHDSMLLPTLDAEALAKSASLGRIRKSRYNGLAGQASKPVRSALRHDECR
jgi:hypothetical protein